ncbi:glycosyltransferase family 2 protein [Xanthobacter wiegelii]|uniref:glycosyltransferase family 2 protein n=1 Tax=Xanthobacter wiegelii TaxID=3119913 RepID=UPI00372803AF
MATEHRDGPVWPPLIEAIPSASGAGLDRVFCDDALLVVTGWVAGTGTLRVEGDDGRLEPDLCVHVARPDVAAAYDFPVSVQGFLLGFRLTHLRQSETLRIVASVGEQTRDGWVSTLPAERLERDLGRILGEYAAARAPLFDIVLDMPRHLAILARSAVPSTAPGAPQGHMEILKSVPGAGGLCVGWTLGEGPFFLIDENGLCQPLEAPERWNRPDIFDAFIADYGAACADAGFLQALPAGFGCRARLIALHGDTLVLAHERDVEPAPRDAVGYARWAFSFPVPPERMAARFSRHDGAVLKTLINRIEHPKNTWVERAGIVPAQPEVSIVVPLYGRYDFVDHQLLEFAEDPFIRKRCEVIYVVDDPTIRAPVFANLDTWWQLYGVPLTLVWGGRNRGFSGASNLGLSQAQGRQVLFLNSDVIPTRSGWLEDLSRRLDDHSDYGLLGTRLLFPSGGVQHDGMVFEYNGKYGVWLNQHPGKGLPPLSATAGQIVPWPAATGACLLGDRAEVAALGGFSEDYLIGDFEDSDLCLKMQAAGRSVGVCPDIALTHLERQSFGLQGSGDFRMRVMLFNAWLHQERWRPAIERHSVTDAGAAA